MRVVSWLIVSAMLSCATASLAELSGAALQSSVARAVIRDLGLSGQEPPEIRLLASELRLTDGVHLRVAGVHAAANGGTWLVRMECDSRVDCLPFAVVLRTRAGGANALSSARRSQDRAVISSAVVRPGQRVQLAEEISGMRLSTAATCLQSGSVGQRVLVRNTATGHVVIARVRSSESVVVEQ